MNGISQIFLKEGKDGNITLIIAKITDVLLMAGHSLEMEEFVEQTSKEFNTSKVVVGTEAVFNGSRILQDQDGNVTMDMRDYVEGIDPIDIADERKAFREHDATECEVRNYQKLAGELVWIGCGVLPQALMLRSMMQQKISTLKVADLVEANKVLKGIRDLEPTVVFSNLGSMTKDRAILIFSDAAFNTTSRQSYGHTGVISGLLLRQNDGLEIYHAIHWVSAKQRWISHSLYGAEILACTDADDHRLSL